LVVAGSGAPARPAAFLAPAAPPRGPRVRPSGAPVQLPPAASSSANEAAAGWPPCSTARASAGLAAACASAALRRRRRAAAAQQAEGRWRVRRAADGDDREGAPEDDDDISNLSLVDMLIKQSRSAVELGINASEWHTDLYDEAPEGYRVALESGIDFVDAVAGRTALPLLAEASGEASPRFALRLAPRPTLGLGIILNKQIVQHWAVLGPLEHSLNRLGVGYVETLVLHSPGAGRIGFPFWVYDAAAEAFRRGLCTKIGISHPSLNKRGLERVAEELQRRGVSLSCAYLRLSLLDRGALELVEECRALGLQVFATEPLGPDELGSGRYTAANPTGGEISVPRFTLAQLMPLRPLHEALSSVAAQARQRCEKQIDNTTVALQWICSKGANPLLDVASEVNAKALAACRDWSLTPNEVEQLDKAAAEVRTRR